MAYRIAALRHLAFASVTGAGANLIQDLVFLDDPTWRELVIMYGLQIACVISMIAAVMAVRENLLPVATRPQ